MTAGPAFWIITGYLCGSIPFGLWIPCLLGKGDPRTVGSGNTGATNVYRLAGLPTAILVYLCDALKGALPTWMAPPEQRLYVAIACVLGHIFSAFLKGKGGKGVATSCGVLLVIMPKTLLLAFMAWFVVWKGTRYVSLASLMGCGAILIAGWVSPSRGHGIFSACLFVILMWSHRSNIVRLIKGREAKVRSPRSKG